MNKKCGGVIWPIISGVILGLTAATRASAHDGTAVQIYRWYQQDHNWHLYSKNPNENPSGWSAEGNVWNCFTGDVSETKPLYRLRAPHHDHLLTSDENEKRTLLKNGWIDEGPLCNVYTTQKPGTEPLHRFYEPQNESNFFGISTNYVSAFGFTLSPRPEGYVVRAGEKDPPMTPPRDDHYQFFGLTLPKCGGSICESVQNVLDEAKAQTLSIPLEQWLYVSRNSIGNNTHPIPDSIRKAMRNHFSDKILSKVKYKVGDNGVLNAANVFFQSGHHVGPDVQAVTLIDVVVFREAAGAKDISLWAHELYHVRQYEEWGAREFSIRYARRFNEVEDPAYAFQDRFDKDFLIAPPN